ncbi:YggS family pyridoxal phosphate-dependent enzyme [bacterium]|nr:YggS family pyridoxal phosphate-dependent enzyme [bacterium]
MATDAAALISGNLQRIREEILELAGDREVRLICVTKYAALEHVRLLLAAGARELGENLLPDSRERFTQLVSEGFRFVRHLIGPQQSRKLSQIPGSFDCFQALDRMKVARVLNDLLRQHQSELDVLLQVNISAEDQKSGFAPKDIERVVKQMREDCPQLRIRGLMAIPAGPRTFATEAEFDRETRRSFGQMRVLFDRISASHPAAVPFDVLSQGMSQDYRLALAEGSNMIRIGSALFRGLEGK